MGAPHYECDDVCSEHSYDGVIYYRHHMSSDAPHYACVHVILDYTYY